GFESFVAEQPLDRVGDRAAVDDRTIDDAVGRHRLDAEGGDLVAFAGRAQLHGLDRARPDVEPDHRFRVVQSKHSVPVLGRASCWCATQTAKLIPNLNSGPAAKSDAARRNLRSRGRARRAAALQFRPAITSSRRAPSLRLLGYRSDSIGPTAERLDSP